MATPSPQKKGTFRSRVGTVMRRSSTAFSIPLAGRSQTPPPPEPSDTASNSGSLKQLDTATLSVPAPAATIAPSPIAESPAREAAATQQEVVKGKSPLSSGNGTIAPQSQPPENPPAAAPAPAPAPASAPISEPVPAPTPAVVASSKPASLSAPESKPASILMPELQPAPTTQAPSVIVSQPAPVFTDEPEDFSGSISDVPQQHTSSADVTNYFDTRRTATPPPIEDTHVSNVWADQMPYPAPVAVQPNAHILAQKQSKSNMSFGSSRGRGSSASSSQPQQSRAVSARPSRSSIRITHTGPPQPKEGTTYTWSNGSTSFGQSKASLGMPTEDPFADPAPSVVPVPVQTVTGPSPTETIHVPEPIDPRSPRDENYLPAPVAPVAMPLPAMHEVMLSKSVREVPSGFNFSTETRSMARSEPDIDERRPLMRPSTPPIATSFPYGSTGSTYRDPPYGYEGGPSPMARSYRAEGGAGQPVAGGWTAQALPHGARYFVHHGMRVTADVDPRRADVTETAQRAITEAGDSRESCEVWVRDGRKSRKRTAVLEAFWVDHNARIISRETPGERGEGSDDDTLDDEFRYWSFVETHPVHVVLPLEARREAIDALNWSLTDRLQGSPHHAPPPFSQEECRDLLELLVSSGDPSRESDIQRAVHTRMVARILLRVVRWRQIYFRAHKPLPRDIGPSARSSRSRYSFPRAIVDVVVGIVCLGIPLLFADRARHGQVDIESGSRYAWPLLAIGGLSCLVAALILSASVTLMTLPGLDTISRIAGLIAIVCSTASMIASLMAFIRYKTDVTRPTSTIGGEGFVFITRRSMILSLPLVFLAYSIAGFITGVVIYSFRGATVTFTSSGIPIVAYRFDEWMRWIIVGVLGTFAGVLIASTVLTRR